MICQNIDEPTFYMNFAHRDLFSGYGHFMFAQDEIQVAEHPLLASIRELMLDRKDRFRPFTFENGERTPVVVRSVPRTIAIDTRQTYGARFARTDENIIRNSVLSSERPTRSNILAIEAPVASGNRIYTRLEIEKALRTAFSGFRALVLSCTDDVSITKPIVLHSGNWGCGAYGGNRQLMISIQIVAASLAGISELVFYCGADSTDSVSEFDSDLKNKFRFRPGVKLPRILDRFVNASFPWGTPDGNRSEWKASRCEKVAEVCVFITRDHRCDLMIRNVRPYIMLDLKRNASSKSNEFTKLVTADPRWRLQDELMCQVFGFTLYGYVFGIGRVHCFMDVEDIHVIIVDQLAGVGIGRKYVEGLVNFANQQFMIENNQSWQNRLIGVGHSHALMEDLRVLVESIFSNTSAIKDATAPPTSARPWWKFWGK